MFDNQSSDLFLVGLCRWVVSLAGSVHRSSVTVGAGLAGAAVTTGRDLGVVLFIGEGQKSLISTLGPTRWFLSCCKQIEGN